MLVEVPCRLVDRINDNQPAADDIDRICGSTERVDQQAGSQALAVEASVEREPGK